MLFKKELVQIVAAGVVWRVARDPHSGEYIGFCDVLNLNAVGDTWEDFQACANEAIEVLFRDLYRENEVEDFLRERGWKLVGEMPKSRRAPRFDVPFGIEHRPFAELTPARA
jgi:predicted RNase H-like HicB family nuclease